jgi:hypothetical protein
MKTTKYIGVTRLLTQPKEANGRKYSFAFDSDMPAEMHTAYRLVTTSDPHALTDASLTAMLKASKRGRLLADLEHNEGHPLSWITIHPEGSDGSGSNNGSVRAQFEQGPSLEVAKAPPGQQKEPSVPTPQKAPPPPPEPESEKPGPEMGW